MRAMSALLVAVGGLVRAAVRNVLDEGGESDVAPALAEIERRREPCAQAASRRAHGAVADPPAVEWMTYAALLVQLDRIVEDLRAG